MLALAALVLWPSAARAEGISSGLVAQSSQAEGGAAREIDYGAAPVQRPAGMTTAPTLAAPVVTTHQGPSAPAETAPALAPEPSVEVGPAPPPAAPPAAEPEPEPEPESSADAPARTGLVARAERPDERFPHRGVVADLRLGTQGCIGGFCRTGAHDVTPGVRLGGFLGGNIRGWFEVGLGGGWGTMRPNVTPGTNALLLYGLDPGVLQQALYAQAAGLLRVDLAGLAVTDAKLRVAQVGPTIRVHFVPRGRFDAFVGSGVGYNLLRARYQTAAGEVGLDFHGVDVPVEANFSVYLHRNVALGVQVDYLWTWYGVAVLDHPQQRVALPLSVLQAAGEQQGADVRGDLPKMWTVGLALRGRL